MCGQRERERRETARMQCDSPSFQWEIAQVVIVALSAHPTVTLRSTSCLVWRVSIKLLNSAEKLWASDFVCVCAMHSYCRFANVEYVIVRSLCIVYRFDFHQVEKPIINFIGYGFQNHKFKHKLHLPFSVIVFHNLPGTNNVCPFVWFIEPIRPASASASGIVSLSQCHIHTHTHCTLCCAAPLYLSHSGRMKWSIVLQHTVWRCLQLCFLFRKLYIAQTSTSVYTQTHTQCTKTAPPSFPLTYFVY